MVTGVHGVRMQHNFTGDIAGPDVSDPQWLRLTRTGDTVTGTYGESGALLDRLENLGVSYSDVVDQLETEGLDKFVVSWGELLETVKTALDNAKEA